MCSSGSGSTFILSLSPCPPGTVPHSHLGCYLPGHPPFLRPPMNLPETERLGRHSRVVLGFPKVVLTPWKNFCLVIFPRSPGRHPLGHWFSWEEGSTAFRCLSSPAQSAWGRAGVCLRLLWEWESGFSNFCTKNPSDIMRFLLNSLILKFLSTHAASIGLGLLFCLGYMHLLFTNYVF